MQSKGKFFDARSLPCPQAVVESKKMIKTMAEGQIITIWFKDDLTLLDFKSFCQIANHELLEATKQNDFYQIKILI
jgi:tRNA 2-thiouridine synthesizing protein A